MDQAFFSDLLSNLAGSATMVLLAVGILIVGWIVAIVASAIVRNVLRRTGLDERLNAIVDEGDGEGSIQIAQWVSKIVFWLVMLLVLAGLFDYFEVGAAAAPLQNLVDTAMGYIPGLIAAGALLVAAWVVASVVRYLVIRAADASDIDERLSQQADLGEQPLSVSSSLATVAFWLAFLIFIPGVLAQLELPGLQSTVNQLVDPVVEFIPGLVAAGILLVVGWIAARIVRQIVTNMLVAAGVDQVGERVGMTSQRTLSGLAGTIAYAFVLIPFAIEALNKAGFASGPATEMLQGVMTAIPNLIGAAILLAVAYFVGTFVADLVASILENVGLNRMPAKLGLADGPAEGARKPSEMVGYVTLVAIMLFAASAAASLLGFDTLVTAIEAVIALGGQVLLAIAILVLGIYLSNIARDVIKSSTGEGSELFATAARWAILLISGAMALGQIDQGGEIIQIAFAALVYAIAAGAALAAGLAFGLGGRGVAGDRLKGWLSQRGD